MIPQEVIEDIRKNADIVQVISSYINVIKKGNSYVAVCPFHNDTNPSLQISKTKQIYKCYSCGAGGNVFTFVQNYEKCSFIDSVRKVADIIGYSSPLLAKPERVIDNETKDVLACLKNANELYQYSINSIDGEVAKNYLLERHIDEDMISYFGLGYSSSNGEMSIKLLQSQGFDLNIIDKAGLLHRTSAAYFDNFQGRVMFPIFNEYSEVVGFSGRRLDKVKDEKYRNSPNTLVFNKSKILYNYQNAKIEAKREGAVYVVEGFMDVFALYKSGVKASVALMGVALTQNHAKMLKKLGVEVRICLDGDDAGQNGQIKMLDILDQENIQYTIVNYKTCTLDPDEVLQQYGPNVLSKLLKRTIDKYDFLIEHYKKVYPLTSVENKKKFVNELIPYISKISLKIDREAMVARISELTSFSRDSISSSFSNVISTSDIDFKSSTPAFKQREILTRLQRCEIQIMYLILAFPDALNDFMLSGKAYFVKDIYNEIFNYLYEYYMINKDYTVSDFISYLAQKDVANAPMFDLITDLNGDELLQAAFKDYSKPLLDDAIKLKEQKLEETDYKTKSRQALDSASSHQEKAQIAQRIIDAKKGKLN